MKKAQPPKTAMRRSAGIRHEGSNKSEIVEDRYENIVFDWRYNGCWQNNNQPTVEKRLAQQCFLDGDWCWDADPFQVTEETKEMVMRNICFLLNNFLRCTAYDNIILCWVMHEQYIIDSIINELDTSACRVIKISLMTDETNLKKRLSSDIARGLRTADAIDRSVGRIRMYQVLDTVKIDTSNKTVREIADEILKL